MKILMLTPYLPYPLLSGGQIRSFHLIKQMAKYHEITLFSLVKDESEKQYIGELEKFCHQVRVFKRSPKPFTIRNIWQAFVSTWTAHNYPFVVIRNFSQEAFGAVSEELEKNNYDLIHAETFYMMPHLPETKVPILLVEQTIEYLGYESFARNFKQPLKFFLKPFLGLDIKKIKKWEKHYWRNCNLLVTMSEEDKEFIARDLKSQEQRIEVVANGVDIKFFKEREKNKEIKPLTVLFVGTFKWLPNVEAAQFLAQKIWPLIKKKIPKARLWIVGNAPTKEIYALAKNDDQIKVTGGIPDIRDAYNKAHVLCAPVFSGKGTRYKILEAMATATAIVATKTAVEGLNIEDGKEALIANSARELAAGVIKVLNDKKLQQSLGKNGFDFVSKHYDWNLISKQLDSLYRSL